MCSHAENRFSCTRSYDEVWGTMLISPAEEFMKIQSGTVRRSKRGHFGVFYLENYQWLCIVHQEYTVHIV